MTNIAVVGAGYWGPNLIRNFHRNKDAHLHSVCDLSEERLADIRLNYPAVATTSRLGDLLADDAIDGITLATPADTHFRMVSACLEAGKHVLVEKPLATSTDECRRLIRLAEERGRVLMVGHTFLYNEAVKRVKDYITSGEIGQLYYINMQRLNLGRVRQDVNVVWNLAPHDISIVLHWLDAEPVAVSARGYTYLQEGLEDVAYINLEFADGTASHIHVSWLDPKKVRQATVVGSQKMIVYDDVNTDSMVQVFDKGITKKDISVDLGKYDTFSKFQLIHRAGDLVIPKINFTEPLALECAHFVDCIQSGKTPISDGRNGLAVVRVLEKIQQSLDQGGQRIELSPEQE